MTFESVTQITERASLHGSEDQATHRHTGTKSSPEATSPPGERHQEEASQWAGKAAPPMGGEGCQPMTCKKAAAREG